MQVHSDTVLDAAATGWAEQRRPLTSGVDEVVLACTSRHLPRAIERRVALDRRGPGMTMGLDGLDLLTSLPRGRERHRR